MKSLVLSAQEIWERCLEKLRQNVPTQHFDIWIRPVRASKIKGQETLVIRVPSPFYYEYLEAHYASLLVQTLRQILGPKAKLEYEITIDPQDKPLCLPGQESPSPQVIPGLKRPPQETHLNPRYTFQNFVEGECNRLARSAGISVSERPGQTAFNPLFLYGSVGQGKTHLAHAIGNHILRIHPHKRVLYMPTEAFINQYIEAIKSKSVGQFLERFQPLDVLILDDVQSLMGKMGTQDILFHVFNNLHQQGKQIILTGDAPPSQLKGLEERVMSRFGWGLSAPLDPPDYETRKAILTYKTRQEGIELPPEVLEYLSENITTHVRDLEGAIITLIAQSSLNRRPITLALAEEIVHRLRPRKGDLSPDQIMQKVAQYFKIPLEELAGKSRRREVAHARHMAMYLLRHHTALSLKAIGAYFGGRDHSTVIHALETIQGSLNTQTAVQKQVQEIEAQLRQK
ncbi:MAG: chromosomal replication initiator protein DnaA [Bacteroidia bacterium]